MKCAFCPSDVLAAVRAPLEVGTPVICGVCRGVMVADVTPDDPTAGAVRRPTVEERDQLRNDPDVKEWKAGADAELFEHEMREAGASTKPKTRRPQVGDTFRPPPVTIRGPGAR